MYESILTYNFFTLEQFFELTFFEVMNIQKATKKKFDMYLEGLERVVNVLARTGMAKIEKHIDLYKKEEIINHNETQEDIDIYLEGQDIIKKFYAN